MLKFRTLRVAQDGAVAPGADSDSAAIQRARLLDVTSRQTSVGAFLRRTSLDELPQLWNVLRGDLSIVGPRPEEIGFAHQFRDLVPGYGARHRVPAGLTGLSQVNGLRGDTSILDRARFDNLYIDTWSLWSDIVIIGRTLRQIVRPTTSTGRDDAEATAAPAPVPAVLTPLRGHRRRRRAAETRTEPR
jgi:lipopolysaccharide/colanic/teichoic acid biosynthesis glycosyltransferase